VPAGGRPRKLEGGGVVLSGREGGGNSVKRRGKNLPLCSVGMMAHIEKTMPKRKEEEEDHRKKHGQGRAEKKEKKKGRRGRCRIANGKKKKKKKVLRSR